MPEQSHRSSPEVLNRRTLERDHQRLAARVRPAIKVLDVGCGRAITAGIAHLVGPGGEVVGIERDEALLEIARRERAAPNLYFEHGDALSMEYDGVFDMATASRVLQWIAAPELAVARMATAVRQGGEVIALDYNHRDNSWEPEPPAAFARFYAGFLAWREANGWDNSMADHLEGMFGQAGLSQIEVYADDEIVERGDRDFGGASAVWGHVIESIGPRIVSAGYLSNAERAAAADQYAEFAAIRLLRQKLAMRTAIGMVSAQSDT